MDDNNNVELSDAGKLSQGKKGKRSHKGGNKKNQDNHFEGAPVSGEEIRGRLVEASSEEELSSIRKVLELEGVNRSSIDGQVWALKKKGKLVFQTAVTTTTGKPQPIEEIIKGIKLPVGLEVLNGKKEIFDAGVSFGMKSIIAGVRLAQELSTMGVAQASPLIRMAQEMRHAEGESAREAAEHAVEGITGQVLAYMDEKLKSPKVDIATVSNPMQGIMARAFERVVDQLFGTMGGQKATGQKAELPTGWTDNR